MGIFLRFKRFKNGLAKFFNRILSFPSIKKALYFNDAFSLLECIECQKNSSFTFRYRQNVHYFRSNNIRLR